MENPLQNGKMWLKKKKKQEHEHFFLKLLAKDICIAIFSPYIQMIVGKVTIFKDQGFWNKHLLIT